MGVKEKAISVPERTNHLIDVAVGLPVFQIFTYEVSEHLIPFAETGCRVLVPFRARKVTGYILRRCNEPPPVPAFKAVSDVLDDHPVFPRSMVPFFQWVADYYLYPIGEVIRTALPSGLNLRDCLVAELADERLPFLNATSMTHAESKIIESLKTRKPVPVNDIEKQITQKLPKSLLFRMAKKGYITLKRVLHGEGTGYRTERYVRVADVPRQNHPTMGPTQKKILEAVEEHGELSIKSLKEAFPCAPKLVLKLSKNGLVRIFDRRVYRDPFGEPVFPDTAPVLTFQQEYVFEQLKTISKKGFSANLLAGVTGSGKTEVYMQLAERVVREGKAVLVLVPEIALISQTERRFRARFGEKVAVLHSGLTSGERFDQWMRIVKGEVPIAIGARSAVFAPFDKIGLIVVDEEHDTAYKQETGLRYNARDLAVIRAKMQNCPVLLGSATPSMQSCYNVTIGKFSELQLNQRVEKRPLPEITVVDLRHCRKIRKGGGLISETLYEAIRDALGRKEQVLLFLNRRGFATISLCKGCGEVFRCPRCDISLTLHKACGQYRCHLCGYRKGSTSRCVSCGSGEIGHLGMGTEKVEAIIASLFPGARTARMDRDTIKGKGSLISLLKDIRKNSVDILIGTQMVAKGHDFPGITLVGVLCADLSLGFPDFRAAEFTFQLLAQVAGRSGRGDTPGKVVLQTYNPNHYSISAAKHQDYRMFYDLEIGFRQGLNYPPFSRLVRLIISGKNAEKTKKAAEEIGGFLENMKRSDLDVFGSVEILGPIKSYLSKISNYHRRQVLLKCATVKPLKQILVSLMESEFRFSRNREAQITLDVDPISML